MLAGLGLENKHTMLVFGFALVVGLLLTPERRLMRSRWFLAGGLIVLLIFLPNLIWLTQHHFAHLEQLANIRRNQRNLAMDPLQFLALQILGMHPLTFPIWLSGLWGFLVSRRVLGEQHRENLERYFTSVREVATVGHPHAMVDQRFPVYLCRGPKGATLQQVWPDLRRLS